MYNHELDIPATVFSSNILDQLGRVTHIFMDKSGTLTDGKNMAFWGASIAGSCYSNENELIPSPAKNIRLEDMTKSLKHRLQMEKTLARQLLKDKQYATLFLTTLALCHTVDADYNSSQDVISYSNNNGPSSEEEISLVKGAAQLGFAFKNRDGSNRATIKFDGAFMEAAYDILHIGKLGIFIAQVLLSSRFFSLKIIFLLVQNACRYSFASQTSLSSFL